MLRYVCRAVPIDTIHALSSRALWIFFAVTAAGCSSNLTRFDIVLRTAKTGGDHQITRSEVADQGSGDGSAIIGPGGHALTKVTLGGSYQRRVGGQAQHAARTGTNGANGAPQAPIIIEANWGAPKAPGGHEMAAGLHANPRATQ